MKTLGKFLSDLFRFRKTSLSFFVVLTFLATIILQEIAVSRSLTPPQDEPKILTDAWEHLQIISSTMHPFTSEENDVLHDYLGSVIETLIDGVPYIKTSYDKNENHTIFVNQHDVFNKSNDDCRVIYYESSNILVKIEGTDPTLPGILVSAHYDSVPTSFGATDDGMGIASMLGILRFWVDSGFRPLRTLIFNFNNNEEFGLLGAEAFVQHKWFSEVSFFINLEGAGAGGMPVLFRGTDKSVIDWYHNARKPYANSIFQEGFNSGFISSQTDYHVYEKSGLRGIDIAFYHPRSFYHTFKDSVKYTSKGSLWMMMSNVLNVLLDIAYSHDSYDSDLEYSVYFDVLNMWFFSFSVNINFVFNVLLLVIVPTINIILFLVVYKRNTWFIGLRGWSRFPVTLIACYYSTLFLCRKLCRLNPLLLSVNYYYPTMSVFSVSILLGYIILKASAYFRPVHDQKLVILLELNFLTWLSLVWITYKIRETKNIGGYLLTILYLLTSIASFWGLIGLSLRTSPCYRPKETVIIYNSTNHSENGTDATAIESSHDDGSPESNPQVHNIGEETADTAQEDQNTESTPLIHDASVVINNETRESFMHKVKHNAINSLQYDWLIQFITLVPLSVFFIYSSGKLVLEAMHETVQESKLYDDSIWRFVVILGTSLAAILMPFIHKMNFITVQLTLLLLGYGLFESYISPAYNESTPIKLRFVETFDTNANSSLANVYGRQGYITQILTEVPYLHKENITCMEYDFAGTETCSYQGNRPWLLSGTLADNYFDQYLNVTVLSNTNTFPDITKEAVDKFTPVESVLEVEVRGARQCYFTFNTTSSKFKAPVKMVTLYQEGNKFLEDENGLSLDFDVDSEGTTENAIPNGMSRDSKGNWIYKEMKGINLLEVHRLQWATAGSEKNKFTIKFQWLPFQYDSDIELISNLGVNMQCHWSGYDDVVSVNGENHDKVPDYVDLMKYTDIGVAWTNLRPGVVQGNAYVEF